MPFAWLRKRVTSALKAARTKPLRAWSLPFHPYLELLENRWLPATFTVLNTNDSGAGTLRQAILAAHANAGVLDTIVFVIPGAGVHTISPTSTLPAISDPVTIDGRTQGGYAGTPLIELAGASTAGNGLQITGGNSTILGLAINR